MPNNLATIAWPLAPKNPSLASGEVHVWRAALDHCPALLHRLREVLAEAELDRASRFYRQQDRERFIISRGLLRVILSGYLGVGPQELHFDYSPLGKPTLTTRLSDQDIGFSISRSSGLFLCAVTACRKVGVDVENVRMGLTFELASARFFSASENAMLAALPENVRPRAFCDFWTRKEAYLKARGTGLSIPPDQVTVWPESSGGFPDNGVWSLWNFVPNSGFAGAVAVEGTGCRLRCWQWTNTILD